MDSKERREKERLKRLQKLQGQPSSPSQSQQTPPSTSPAPKNEPSSHSNVLTQTVPTPTVPKETAAGLDGGAMQDVRVDEKKGQRRPETIEEWSHEMISRVLLITFDPCTENLHYMSTLHEEMSEEMQTSDSTPFFTFDNLDRIVLSRISNEELTSSPFEYLLASYKRAETMLRGVRKQLLAQEKGEILNEIMRLCISYAGLSVTMPEILNQMTSPAPLVEIFVKEDQEEDGIPTTFLQELITKFVDEGEGGLAMFFEPVIYQIVGRIRDLTIESTSIYPLISAFRRFLRFPDLVSFMVGLEAFNPTSAVANNIEKVSILGPFFKLSPISAQVAQNTFGNGVAQAPGLIENDHSPAVRNGIDSLRTTCHTLYSLLFDISNALVRSSADSRKAFLAWVSRCLNINRKRGAMQVEASTVASDGFMLNILHILNMFSEPFVSDNSKMDKIDVQYLRSKHNLVEIEGETRLASTEQETAVYYAGLDIPGNFISQMFFLNVAFHHYALSASISNYQKVLDSIRDIQKYRSQVEHDRPFPQTPQGRMMELQYERLGKQLEQARAIAFCYEAVLCDEPSQTRSFGFLSLVAAWIIRLVDPAHSYPQRLVVLPLPSLDSKEPQIEAYRNLPEYFIEDIAEFFQFVGRFIPKLLINAENTDLVIFALVFLKERSYIKNPYLKAKLVEILYHGIRPLYRGEKTGPLSALLNSHPFVLSHLFPALMGYYIDVESTGVSSQFYDKFNIRYNISQIFKSIWNNPTHRQKLENESKTDIEFFVRFIALLLNDQTYLLDEALSKLKEIHELQIELESGNLVVDSEEYKEKLGHLTQAERSATSYLQLGGETLQMLNLYTQSIPDAFCTPEIVDRLATMLDYNIDALVGPKCKNLRVKEPEKYHWNPVYLLNGIVGIFLNMKNFNKFLMSVAKDGRSYKREHFIRAAGILSSKSSRPGTEIEDFITFVSNVEKKPTPLFAGGRRLGRCSRRILGSSNF